MGEGGVPISKFPMRSRSASRIFSTLVKSRETDSFTDTNKRS